MSETLKVKSKKYNDADELVLDSEELKTVVEKVLTGQLGNIDLDALPYVDKPVEELSYSDVEEHIGQCFESNDSYVFYPVGSKGLEGGWIGFSDSDSVVLLTMDSGDLIKNEFLLSDITKVRANPTLAGTENELTGIQIGSTKYKVPKLDVGDIINLGQAEIIFDDASQPYFVVFRKGITIPEYDNIPDSGLAIIMFNTTCQILPYAKNQLNRFVCSGVYNSNGETHVVRGRLQISSEPAGIEVRLDKNFAEDLDTSQMTLPYGIIRFIGF